MTSSNKWNKRASNLLKAELKKMDVSYDELCKKLKKMGCRETIPSITCKINRGTFKFAFFLQCMKALDVDTVHL